MRQFYSLRGLVCGKATFSAQHLGETGLGRIAPKFPFHSVKTGKDVAHNTSGRRQIVKLMDFAVPQANIRRRFIQGALLFSCRSMRSPRIAAGHIDPDAAVRVLNWTSEVDK